MLLDFFIKKFLPATTKNCKMLCSHCEVEVSERTASAIVIMLSRKIKQVSNNNSLRQELTSVKEDIQKGNWHEDYDTIIR